MQIFRYIRHAVDDEVYLIEEHEVWRNIQTVQFRLKQGVILSPAFKTPEAAVEFTPVFKKGNEQ